MSANEAAIRTLVVDDHRSYAEALSFALARADGIESLDCAFSVHDAMARVQAEEPDVVILDWQLPDTDGVEGIGRIKALRPSTTIILISGYFIPAFIYIADKFQWLQVACIHKAFIFIAHPEKTIIKTVCFAFTGNMIHGFIIKMLQVYIKTGFACCNINTQCIIHFKYTLLTRLESGIAYTTKFISCIQHKAYASIRVNRRVASFI